MTDARSLPWFPEEPDAAAMGALPVRSRAQAVARVLMPNRTQIELRAVDLESLLPERHRARVVWAYVQQADRSRIYAGIKAVAGGGRTHADRPGDSAGPVAVGHRAGRGQCPRHGPVHGGA